MLESYPHEVWLLSQAGRGLTQRWNASPGNEDVQKFHSQNLAVILYQDEPMIKNTSVVADQ